MMKPLIMLSCVTCLILPVHASNLSDAYFTGKNPQLTPQERAAIALAKKWQASNASGMKPVAGPDGSIRFLFGSQQPSIVCAVLQVCDIELQPGEQVNSIHLGDQARWLIEPAVTGQGVAEVQHLIVKPMDVGLETSLVVTTNRRTYHMRLRSHRREFMPRVGFIIRKMRWPNGMRSKQKKAMPWKSNVRALCRKPASIWAIWTLPIPYPVVLPGSLFVCITMARKPLYKCPKFWRRQKRRPYCCYVRKAAFLARMKR